MWFTFESRESFMGGQSYSCSIKEQSTCDWQNISYESYYHKHGMTDKDVKSVIIEKASFKTIPKRLIECFPNMESLEIRNTEMTELDMDTMYKFKKLKRFASIENKISILSGDLFKDFESLECIQFKSCPLILVDPAILDGLVNLKHVEFTGDGKYDKRFSKYPGKFSFDSLDSIKQHLIDQFSKFKYVRNLQESVELNPYLGLFHNIKEHLQDEQSKDLSIHIDGQKFRVHKFVMAIRSPFFAKLFQTRLFTQELNFDDVSAEIFENIIKYVYNNELPEQTDCIKLFMAAFKFQIKDVKNHAEQLILSDVNGNNAFDVFELGHKYDNDNLKTQAYEEIKKKYSVFDFKDEWLADSDGLMKILDGLRKQEEELNKFRMKFERMLRVDPEQDAARIYPSSATRPAREDSIEEIQANNSF